MSKLILAERHKITFLRFVRQKILGAIKEHLSAPLIIQLYLTERCNLNCAMCHAAQSRKKQLSKSKGEDLAIEILERVFREMREYQPAYYITGGEPLIYKNLFEVISEIKRNRSLVGLVTNGYKLNEFYKDIVDGGVDFISVSLDGSNEEIHDESRGVKGSFVKAISGIENLLRYRGSRLFPRIKVNTVIRKDNLENLVDIFHLVTLLGVDEMSLEHFSYYYPKIQELADRASVVHELGNYVIGCKIGRKSYLTSDEIQILRKKLKEVEHLAKKYKIRFELKPKTDDIEKYYMGDLPGQGSKCRDAFFNVRIRQSGDIELCQGIIIGNIHNDKLCDAWHSERANQFRSYLKRHNNTPACFRCLGLNYRFHST